MLVELTRACRIVLRARRRVRLLEEACRFANEALQARADQVDDFRQNDEAANSDAVEEAEGQLAAQTEDLVELRHDLEKADAATAIDEQERGDLLSGLASGGAASILRRGRDLVTVQGTVVEYVGADNELNQRSKAESTIDHLDARERSERLRRHRIEDQMKMDSQLGQAHDERVNSARVATGRSNGVLHAIRIYRDIVQSRYSELNDVRQDEHDRV